MVQSLVLDDFFFLAGGLTPQFVAVISSLCAIDGVMKFGS